MKVEATVDVGQNLTSLVERLAQQIGVTADKVFPWYVEQAYLQGVTTLASIGLCFLVFGILFAYNTKRAKIPDDGNSPNPAFFMALISGIALVFALIVAFVHGPMQVRKMMNPNFYAVQMLAEDIGKMRGR